LSNAAILAAFPDGASSFRKSALICAAVGAGTPTITLPAQSTATQNDVGAHATPARTLLASIVVAVHACDPPVGFVEATTPPPMVSTHTDVDPQATPAHRAAALNPPVSTWAAFQARTPPVGFLEVKTVPPELSTATHSDGEAHDTLAGK
jgi:hypothetical protein